MGERVRITNETLHDVGLRNQNGIEYNIRPGTFIALPRDDAEYMVAIARRLFDTGELRIDSEELAKDLNLIAPGEPSPADENAIRKALGGTVGSVKKYIQTLTEPFIIDTVCRVAKAMDLPDSKMKALREAFPNKFLDD